MLINASKSTHFICAAALSLGFSMPVAAAPQTNETESNLTGFSTERNVTSFKVNYAYRF